MTAFDRVLQFSRAAKERVSPIWTATVTRIERGQQWLQPRTQVAFLIAGIIIVILLLAFSGVTAAVAAAAA